MILELWKLESGWGVYTPDDVALTKVINFVVNDMPHVVTGNTTADVDKIVEIVSDVSHYYNIYVTHLLF